MTPVLRGCVYDPETRSVSRSVEAQFGFAEILVVSFLDLYAGMSPRSTASIRAPCSMSAACLRMRESAKNYGRRGQGRQSEFQTIRVRIWSHVLTSDEIPSLFTDDTVTPDGLAGEYHLDQGAGASAPDSVSGNDGTIFGAQWAQES